MAVGRRLTVALAALGLARAAGGSGAAGVRLIGAGLPSTGTQSVVTALELLGYRPVHGIDLFFNPSLRAAWDRWLHFGGDFEPALQALLDSGHDATLDTPMNWAYQELMRRYPAAKVLLTVRDNAERWYESCKTKDHSPGLLHLALVWWLGWYAGTDRGEYVAFLKRNQARYNCSWLEEQTPELRSRCIAGYLGYNERVRRSVPPERLLEFNVKQGWGPLCSFLGVPEPQEPFPWKDYTKREGRKDRAFHFSYKAWKRLWEPLVVLFAPLCLVCCLGAARCRGHCRRGSVAGPPAASAHKKEQ